MVPDKPTKATAGSDVSSLRPYSFLFHPHRPWLDKLWSWIFSFIIPFNVTTGHPPKALPGTKAMKERLQKRIDAVQKFMLKPACSKWSALYGGLPIVERVMQLPRRGDILVELGLLSKEEMQLMQPEHNGFVNVLIRFPITMLPDATKIELLTKGKRSPTSGCLQMESFNLCEIPAEVPILIWCHGGGLTLGSFDDPDGVEAVSSIVGLASTFGKSKR